jgi:hypothetical protein
MAAHRVNTGVWFTGTVSRLASGEPAAATQQKITVHIGGVVEQATSTSARAGPARRHRSIRQYRKTDYRCWTLANCHERYSPSRQQWCLDLLPWLPLWESWHSRGRRCGSGSYSNLRQSQTVRLGRVVLQMTSRNRDPVLFILENGILRGSFEVWLRSVSKCQNTALS